MRSLFIALSIFLLPGAASAAVVINEVAWMGSSDNANAEWIELYNDGTDTVSLSGWKVVSSSGTPSITITGTISAGGFYLLTRTSTSIIPGVTGDQSYTGALSNTGVTLTLKDGTGTTVDEVAGGTNWTSIGGDNATKETAQRSGNTWITAEATPRAANSTDAAPDDDDDILVPEVEATTTPTATIGGSSTTSGLGTFTFPRLYINPGQDRIVMQYAETPFRAYVYDERGKERRTSDVTWSFGNGVRERGSEVLHAYELPGDYLVVVRASTKQATSIRTLKVTVIPASVSVESVSEMGVTLVNDGEHIADLSGWQLRGSERTFVIPEDTALLPHGRTVFIPKVTRIAASSTAVALHYPNGTLAVASISTPSAKVFTAPVTEEEVRAVEVPLPATPSLLEEFGRMLELRFARSPLAALF